VLATRIGHVARQERMASRSASSARDPGFRGGEAATWDSLSHTHHQLGSHQQSIDCYRHAIDIYRDQADQLKEADTLSSLGDAVRGCGDVGADRQAWTLALQIFDQLSHPDADRVRAKLNSA
jgi:tetratricopeptide (TPR) repeat protein